MKGAIDEEGNPTRFLGGYHNHGVGTLRDTERGPMSRPKIWVKIGIEAERKHASGGFNSAPLYDHSPIVKGRLLGEDAEEDLGTHLRVKVHTLLHKLLKPDLSLNHHQTSKLRFRELVSRQRDLIEHLMGNRFAVLKEKGLRSNLGERSTDIVLKDYYNE